MSRPESATKRTASTDDGGSSAKRKAEEREELSVTQDEKEVKKDDEGDETTEDIRAPNLPEWPAELLHPLFALLDGPARVSLSQTCKRLYEVEKTAPVAMNRSKWSHLAVKSSVQAVGQRAGQRLTRRGRGQVTRVMIEFELSNDVMTTSHHWRTPAAEASVLLKSLLVTTTFDDVSVQLDYESVLHSALVEMLHEIQCTSLSLVNKRDGAHEAFKEKDEVALLPACFLSTASSFFPKARTLSLEDFRLDDYALFYQRIKESSLRGVIWRITAGTIATREFTEFALQVMGMVNYREGNKWLITKCDPDRKLYMCSMRSAPYSLKFKDGQWRTRVEGNKGNWRTDQRFVEITNEPVRWVYYRRVPYVACD